MNQSKSSALQKNNIKPTQKSLAARLTEPDRFRNFSAGSGDLLLDFSRTGMDRETLAQLLGLAADLGVENARKRLFGAEDVNYTEKRPALHMAMRSDDVLERLDEETIERVRDTRRRMLSFASAFAAGHLPGRTERPGFGRPGTARPLPSRSGTRKRFPMPSLTATRLCS